MGLSIDCLGLNEPLRFSHYKQCMDSPCRFPIAGDARRMAASIRKIRESYPDARIVDYEFPSLVPVATWTADLPVWLNAFKAAAGERFDALVLDVNWRVAGLDRVRPTIDILRRNGVRAGMFLTIAGPGTSNKGAVASLRDNIRAVDAAKLGLDLERLSAWTACPSRLGTSADPRTLTSVPEWDLERRGRGR